MRNQRLKSDDGAFGEVKAYSGAMKTKGWGTRIHSPISNREKYITCSFQLEPLSIPLQVYKKYHLDWNSLLSAKCLKYQKEKMNKLPRVWCICRAYWSLDKYSIQSRHLFVWPRYINVLFSKCIHGMFSTCDNVVRRCHLQLHPRIFASERRFTMWLSHLRRELLTSMKLYQNHYWYHENLCYKNNVCGKLYHFCNPEKRARNYFYEPKDPLETRVGLPILELIQRYLKHNFKFNHNVWIMLREAAGIKMYVMKYSFKPQVAFHVLQKLYISALRNNLEKEKEAITNGVTFSQCMEGLQHILTAMRYILGDGSSFLPKYLL